MPYNKEIYPPDWEARAERIKQRDGYQCQAHQVGLPECGAQAGEERPGKAPVVLTCAHLDHDEHNWAVTDERLLTLCDACHLRYDAADNAARRNYGKYYRHQQFRLDL